MKGLLEIQASISWVENQIEDVQKWKTPTRKRARKKIITLAELERIKDLLEELIKKGNTQ